MEPNQSAEALRPERFYASTFLGELLDMRPRSLRAWLESEGIEPHRLGHRTIRYPGDQVIAALERARRAGATKAEPTGIAATAARAAQHPSKN